MKFASTGSRAGSRPPRSTEGGAGHPAAGFTLLETLTAMLILAIALVSLFDAQMRGLRAAGATETYAEARILGDALLADAVSGWKSGPRLRSGTEGRYRWSIAVAPAAAGWAQIKSKGNWRLNHIRVTVAWDQNRSIVLDTLKLGQPGKSDE